MQDYDANIARGNKRDLLKSKSSLICTINIKMRRAFWKCPPAVKVYRNHTKHICNPDHSLSTYENRDRRKPPVGQVQVVLYRLFRPDLGLKLLG
jgi:hypothetical protein